MVQRLLTRFGARDYELQSGRFASEPKLVPRCEGVATRVQALKYIFDPQVLFDGFEEQLDLLALVVDGSNPGP